MWLQLLLILRFIVTTAIMQQSPAQAHLRYSKSRIISCYHTSSSYYSCCHLPSSLQWGLVPASSQSHQTYCCHSYYYYYYLAATVPILAAKILLHPHSLHMISVPTSTTSLQVLSPNSTVTYHHVTHHTILSMPLTAPGVPVSAVVLILYPISCQFQTTLDFV